MFAPAKERQETADIPAMGRQVSADPGRMVQKLEQVETS
jgi:hypothetical protein